MKKSNLFLSVALILFMAFAWFAYFENLQNEKLNLKMHIENATEFENNGLYQKALQSYEQALNIDDNLETRTAYLEAYEKAYADGVVSLKEFRNALSQTCNVYPEYIDGWHRLLTLLINENSYTSAFDVCKQIDKYEIVSDKLTPLINNIKYSIKNSSKKYYSFARSSSGYYNVSDSYGMWGVLAPNGERIVEHQYKYIAPHSTNGIALYVSDTDSRLMKTEESFVEAVLPNTISQAGAVSNGFIPIKYEEKWSYLNVNSKKNSDNTYDFASNYNNGIAAICNGGKWELIDENEKQITNLTFDDIKIQSNGDFCYDGIMIASLNGKYGLYNTQGIALCEFSCSNADLYYGELIAFCDKDGKWGFVDVSGKVIIEPKFKSAKSFSGGLAAVSNGDSWGYINADGDVVIDYQYCFADYFTSDGMTLVSQTSDEFYMISLRFSQK